MSYTKNTWKSGDTVTSAKLNNIEDGIASSGAFMVHGTISDGTVTLDKTWKEIYNAVQEKYVGIIIRPAEGVVVNLPIIGVESFDSTFVIATIGAGEGLETTTFMTDSEDGYPMYVIGNSNQHEFAYDTSNLGRQ